jgi:hypothetical protein
MAFAGRHPGGVGSRLSVVGRTGCVSRSIQSCRSRKGVQGGGEGDGGDVDGY